MLCVGIAGGMGCRPAVLDSSEAPELVFNLSLHLEGTHWYQDGSFELYAGELERLAGAVEGVGGRLTCEARAITEASLDRDDDTLARLLERGHAVGSHSDLWGRGDGGSDYQQAVDVLVDDRRQLRALGIDARHLSGACTDLDWVGAAVEAGYTSIGGMVAWCAKTLDDDLRPPGIDACESPVDCHDAFLYFPDRLQPWRVSSAARWTEEDPNGAIILIPEATVLGCNHEQVTEPDGTDCTFDEEDLPLFFADLDRALSLAKPDDLNVFSVAWSMGAIPDEQVFAQWLSRMEPYIDDGRVTWAGADYIVERFRDLESRSEP